VTTELTVDECMAVAEKLHTLDTGCPAIWWASLVSTLIAAIMRFKWIKLHARGIAGARCKSVSRQSFA
jgi:hypothetical protein